MKSVHLLSVLTLALAACSPADWAAVQTAGSAAGAVVDTFALVRARQIEAKSAEAQGALKAGDTFAALRALAEAQASVTATTLEDLAAARHELADLRARCPAPPSSATAISQGAP
jgi:uncharacterized transporter YbjL